MNWVRMWKEPGVIYLKYFLLSLDIKPLSPQSKPATCEYEAVLPTATSRLTARTDTNASGSVQTSGISDDGDELRGSITGNSCIS
jgi:hypothetical protein